MSNTTLVTLTIPLDDFLTLLQYDPASTHLVNLRFDRTANQVQVITEPVPDPA